MRDTEPTPPEAKQLRAKLDSLKGRDWISAATRPTLGSLDFASLVPILSALETLVHALERLDLSSLPPQRLNQIARSIDNFLGVYNQIDGFDIGRENARNQRDHLINQLRDTYNQIVDSAGPALACWAATAIDPEAIKLQVSTELQPALTESQSQYNQALDDIRSAKGEADRALAAIKEAAGKSGVSAHAKVFSEQATEHLKASKLWVGLTVVALLGIIAWGLIVILAFPIPPNASAGSITQEIFTRVIVFTGLSYALVWCARNYAAHRHNYILNKHRQNSLTTFEAFAKAADDPDTKNAVLIQATTSIFSAQATGYGGRDGEIEQPSKILEIFKSAKGG